MKTINSVFPLGMDSREIATSPSNEALSIVFKKTIESVESTKTALNLISKNFVQINDNLQEDYMKLSNFFYRRFNCSIDEYNTNDIVVLMEESLNAHEKMILELKNLTSMNMIVANGAHWPIKELIRAHILFQEYLKKIQKSVV